MSDLYNATQGNYGSYTSPVPGGSSSKGYYERPLNIPYYSGRSILATIPEYQRNPLMLERDLLFKISEGRSNFMKIILETIEQGGGYSVNDVKYRMPIEVEPVQRIYLKTGAVSAAAATTGLSTFKIESNTTKVATAMPGGNPKQVGDIARLEVGQMIMLMFSWVEPRRTSAAAGSRVAFYYPQASKLAPVPELAKIVSVDKNKSEIKVERLWAGAQRTTAPTYNTAAAAFTVDARNATPTWEVAAGNETIVIPQEYAYFIPMTKSMKEDEIDATVRNYSNTWQHGIVQRHLLAYGSQHFAEVISSNLGIESPLAKSKRQAIKDYYDHWEWTALFGEKDEEFDSNTGFWQGWTDGILANLPKSHYIALQDIDYASGFTAGASTNMGSFHPLIFNKVMQGKGHIGSGRKVLVCGEDAYTAFSTMINHMTQHVPDIKSEWKVEGKAFKTSGGLSIDVVPSDKMSLHGMGNMMIMYDKEYFKPVTLNGYPAADIVEVNNENPLKKNGFIHGVKSFIDLNPDAHWVFSVVPKLYPDGSSNATAYAAVSALGSPLE
jgi:hypothetical protein